MLSTHHLFRSTIALAAVALVCTSLAARADDDGGDDCGGGGNSLHCDAGGPYHADCTGGTITVHLDGTGSSGATSWSWSSDCPNASFDDAHSPMPTLTFVLSPNGSNCGCNSHCEVHLTVGDGHHTKSCSANVDVQDHTPPVIHCPDKAKVLCGDSTDPSITGYATATDNCDPNPTITYTDHILQRPCPADRFDHMIMRKWKAVDHCGNKAECVQIIDVLKIEANLDVLPGVCPNRFKCTSDNGYFPVAILGSALFDVTKIKLSSVRLYSENCTGGPVHPHHVQFGDVSTPANGPGPCNCNMLGGDGQMDLTLFFKRNELAQALGLCSLSPGTVVHIVVEGKLDSCEECKFIGTDCLIIQ